MMKFLIIIVLGLVYAVFHSFYKSRENKKRIDRLSQAAMKDAFSELEGGLPTMKIVASYGFSSYAMTFRNEEHLEEAETKGRNKVFIQAVQNIHSNISSFEGEQAVFFTYEGQEFGFQEVDSDGNPIF